MEYDKQEPATRTWTEGRGRWPILVSGVVLFSSTDFILQDELGRRVPLFFRYQRVSRDEHEFLLFATTLLRGYVSGPLASCSNAWTHGYDGLHFIDYHIWFFRSRWWLPEFQRHLLIQSSGKFSFFGINSTDFLFSIDLTSSTTAPKCS